MLMYVLESGVKYTGLASMFTKTKCLCSKYCGKEAYKSPEVIKRKQLFDAKANDIWCLGVCLFMLNTGSAPWDVAHESDSDYVCAMQKSIFAMLKVWNMLHFVDNKMLYLLDKIFKFEEKRMNIHQIRQYIEEQ